MYTVGIDIGSEVTIVSRSPGYGGEKVSQILLKHKQNTIGKEIKNEICKINDEWSLCPEWLEISSSVKITKHCWLEDTLNKEKENFSVFIQLLFQAIIESDTELKYDATTGIKNFDLIVAYPDHWEHQIHNATIKYRTFLKTMCGLPVDCTPTEAEVRFRISNSLTFNGSHDKIFVIDIDIDTIDFTSLPCWSNNYNCCWSLNLGAHHIVDILMYKILRIETNTQNLQRLIEYKKSMKGNSDFVVYKLSKLLKEQIKEYFIEGRDTFRFCIPFSDLTPCWTGPVWENCIEYEVSKEEFNESILGYMRQIKDAINNAKIRLSQSAWKPQCIFITGNWGATLSNIDIISYLEEIFGVKVYFDVCPETSISKGLALTRIIRV